jgi:hypothetical protein
VKLLQPISPISEEAIRPYCGKQVCAVLSDGTHIYGTISDCRDGQLYFSGSAQGPGTVSTNAKRAKTQIQSKINNKATISFFPFFGFGGGAALAVSIALIAALFAFPFGFGAPFFF